MAEKREELIANFEERTARMALEEILEAVVHLIEENRDSDGGSVMTRPPDGENVSLSTSGYIPLKVDFNNYRYTIMILESLTVNDLKKKIQEVSRVPVDRQQILGLGGSGATSTTRLGTLGLQPNSVLQLADALISDDEHHDTDDDNDDEESPVSEMVRKTLAKRVRKKWKLYTRLHGKPDEAEIRRMADEAKLPLNQAQEIRYMWRVEQKRRDQCKEISTETAAVQPAAPLAQVKILINKYSANFAR